MRGGVEGLSGGAEVSGNEIPSAVRRGPARVKENRNDLANNGRSRLFTYAAEDGLEGVLRGGRKGSLPRALFVFVGPHSVIRLRNALRPSSFPPADPLACLLPPPRRSPGVATAAVESARR
ncbi:hypothetical protein KM043_018019 [Ampulex compressa]|nr:hypothetical protein KM043_018019 [Ampulex compressa]